MPFQVVNGAQMACTFGAAPACLTVLPINRAETSDQPEATVQDYVPMLNINPFGMCMSPSNPQVAAATAAAMGVLTPQPCMPATTSPWTPGSPTVQINNKTALDNVSICNCMWGGVISITDPGEQTVQIP
ncbi:MAG TPA: DUF4280 domain-containing protein [Acetobacteraceae bacterium]|jgi:hypothetical protein|nr:DUF4280 domain-containing protein [Acetobacteraceae bacterium]